MPSLWNVSRRFLAISAAMCTMLTAGCAPRLELPPMGPLLPYAARLELSPSVTTPTFQYVDNCGHIHEIQIGSVLEQAITEATYRTFQAVITESSKTKEPFPEITVRVELVQQKLELTQDNLYDRVPAYVQLSALARFYDASGKLLRESDIKVDRTERLLLERFVGKDCNYIIDPFIHDTAVDLASKFMQEARVAVGSGSQVAAAPPASGNAGTAAVLPPAKLGQPGSSQASTPAVPPVTSSLRFKATALDENSNLVFEGGERIRVRVDLVNTGDQEIQGATASLSGTPSLLSQFPVSSLAVGRLQPGQSRSIEFVATLPQSVQSQKTEIQVTVSDPAGPAPPPQTVSLSIQPASVNTDDVDQIPAVADGFRRPHTYLISIGIGSYRDQHLSTRKFASLDAEMMASYFQSLGGLPAANVRLLQDWKALRPDIDEALLDWLPPHMNKEAIVIVYFAGMAMVSSTGDTFLVPYEGSASSTSRLYPLRDLEAGLTRLKARQTVFIFDGLVSRLGPETKTKVTNPQWGAGGSSTVYLISPSGLGNGLEDERHRHGLFTYYLLRGLRGDADVNRDGDITIGEVIQFVSQKVAWAAKARFNREQRVLSVPSLRPSDKTAELILTKVASIQGAEAR